MAIIHSLVAHSRYCPIWVVDPPARLGQALIEAVDKQDVDEFTRSVAE